MKKRFIIIFLLFTITFKFLKAQEIGVVPGNIIVMVNSVNDVNKLIKDCEFINGIKTDFKLDRILSQSLQIYLFDFNSDNINQDLILHFVNKNPLVKIAQFNHTFQERVIPNDTQFTSMWDMNNLGTTGGTLDTDIDAPEAWDITTGGLTSQGDTIVVAAIDGGFDLTHPDLNFFKNYNEIAGNGIDDDANGYIDDVKGWNAETNNDAIPSASHGTHLAGTIGARGNNNIGVTGVNWSVKVMAVSYGSPSAGQLESFAIASYAYVLDQRKLYNQTNGAKGAFVVATNSSFGVDHGQPTSYPLWCAMYDSLGTVGILSAAATANQNWNIDAVGDVPSACNSNWLVTVTNTTNTDFKNTSAGYGSTTIDLGAPGTAIISTTPGNTYGVKSGTSMATPHVAGAIALMYSVPCLQFMANYKTDPAGVALMVKDSLLGAVDLISDLSIDNYPTVTGGRLNLFNSIKSIQNYCTTTTIIESDKKIADFGVINVYPNPATDYLHLVYSSDTAIEICITNVFGQEIKRLQEIGDKSIRDKSIDLSGINKGVYFVSLKCGIKKSNVVKLIVY